MGKIQGGILGSVKAKVAGAVFYNLRGQQVVRKYAIPSNPNSLAQQGQRNKFTATVKLAKAVKSFAIDAYWKQRQKGKTTPAWGAFMSKNVKLYDAIKSYRDCRITDGQLENASSITYNLDVPSNEFEVSWISHGVTNGEPSDIVNLVIYDAANSYFYISPSVNRSDGEIDTQIPEVVSGREYIIWVVLHSVSNPKLWNNQPGHLIVAP